MNNSQREPSPSSPPETQVPVTELLDGMLRQRLYVCLSCAQVPPDAIAPVLGDHLRHMISLEKDGVLFGSGPFLSEHQPPAARGMTIIRANDRADAQSILDRDPFHAKGLRTYELLEWQLNEGRVGVQVDFSDRSYRLT